MTPDLARLLAANEATWPPAACHRIGPWMIRTGRSGGKRVSAATAKEPVTAADIPLAEAAMDALGQPALFMVREDQKALDTLLATAGYTVADQVAAYLGPATLDAAPPPISAFDCWPPLAIQCDLWTAGGIGRPRMAVMNRVTLPKAAILGRINDRAAGTAFVALDHDIAMMHALVVAPEHRRQGAARNILRGALRWAQDQGAKWFGLAVTTGNVPARGLYSSHGLQLVGHYHYRMR